MNFSYERPIVVDYFSFHKTLDPAEILTAGQFRVLANLLRPLTQLDVDGQIIGNLADSWKVRDNYTRFEFTLSEGAKFSDGSPILAEDVEASIKRQVRFNSGNHFDFSTVKKVELDGPRNLTIFLKKPDVHFIRHVSYPEFGVIRLEDIDVEYGKLNFHVTSGPYFLKERGGSHFLVEANRFFDDFNPLSPTSIRFQFSNPREKASGLLSGAIDLSASSAPFDRDLLKKIEEAAHLSITQPNLGYSVWLTINPNSEIFSDIGHRQAVQKVISEAQFDFTGLLPVWQPARQLYLPDGLGRPDKETLENFWKKIGNGPSPSKIGGTISILLEKAFPFKDKLISELERKLGFKVLVTEIESGTEFFTALSTRKFDLIQARNDFSSVDLNENLQTTFNPNTPLVFTTMREKNYDKKLNEALATEDEEKKHEIYRFIALDLLEKAFIVPIAYYKVVWIHKKSVRFERISKLVSDSGLWKLEVSNRFQGDRV